MINDKGILIKNIYYMLSYAFKNLKYAEYEDSIKQENFNKIEDLFAAILILGLSKQIKQGLYREYVNKSDNLDTLRGKLDINATLKNRLNCRQSLACSFDELLANNLFNKIIKTTIYYLLQAGEVSEERKKRLKQLLVYFVEIDILNPRSIKWDSLQYQRHNRSYETLLNVCFFVLHGLLQTTDKGEYKLQGFKEEQMAALYERFILEYYRHHYPYLKPKAKKLAWNVQEDYNMADLKFLPDMQTDIFLTNMDKTLIIDAKYYGRILQSQYEKNTVRSNHMYQIFTYVKNHDREHAHKTAGFLLYAKTKEEIVPDCQWIIDGSLLGTKNLDLYQDFTAIKAQLNNLVDEYFTAN